MRFKSGIIVVALLVLPQLALGVTGAEVTASNGDIINFDPSQNSVGVPGSGQPLTDSSGSIKALTYLSGADDPATVAIRLINLTLSFLGAISLIFMLYAGYVWFTARDNEEEAKRAKQIIVGAVTGLVITMSAYGIATLVYYLAASAAGDSNVVV